MLIIKEYSVGGAYMGSKSFVATESGYSEAYSYIQAIKSRGNRADGDAGKVLSYFGQ